MSDENEQLVDIDVKKKEYALELNWRVQKCSSVFETPCSGLHL
jgi:hypothetical protein